MNNNHIICKPYCKCWAFCSQSIWSIGFYWHLVVTWLRRADELEWSTKYPVVCFFWIPAGEIIFSASKFQLWVLKVFAALLSQNVVMQTSNGGWHMFHSGLSISTCLLDLFYSLLEDVYISTQNAKGFIWPENSI